MSGIINLSRAASIGIHACALIAKSENRMNSLMVAKALNCSTHHVAKVLQKLALDGILNSTKGPTGGFALELEPKQITLLEIYESVQGPLETDCQCPEHSDEDCPFEDCIWGKFGNDTREGFREYLQSRTLADL